MGPTVGWSSLLIEFFWPKLCSNGFRKGWIRLWPAGLNWHFGAETDLFNFQCCSRSLGPLRSDDGNSNENVKKTAIGLINKTTATTFENWLTSCFMEEVNKQRRNFFLFLNVDKVPIWQSKQSRPSYPNISCLKKCLENKRYWHKVLFL